MPFLEEQDQRGNVTDKSGSIAARCTTPIESQILSKAEIE
jgi:hypothetical protein